MQLAFDYIRVTELYYHKILLGGEKIVCQYWCEDWSKVTLKRNKTKPKLKLLYHTTIYRNEWGSFGFVIRLEMYVSLDKKKTFFRNAFVIFHCAVYQVRNMIAEFTCIEYRVHAHKLKTLCFLNVFVHGNRILSSGHCFCEVLADGRVRLWGFFLLG
jgi:hypothetical protein